jgi:hypothetical protein
VLPAVAQAPSNSGRIQADLIGPPDRWLVRLPIGNRIGLARPSLFIDIGRPDRSGRPMRIASADADLPQQGSMHGTRDLGEHLSQYAYQLVYL